MLHPELTTRIPLGEIVEFITSGEKGRSPFLDEIVNNGSRDRLPQTFRGRISSSLLLASTSHP